MTSRPDALSDARAAARTSQQAAARPGARRFPLHLTRRSATLLLLGAAVAAAAPAVAAPPGADLRSVATRPRDNGLPEGWHHGAFMEIFVRSWRDSDGDGIGDLNGLIASLDDLQALGIRGIWLMPIQRSADYDHGYATTDFRDVEPAYGTLADFDALLRQAHARGIGVIMDYTLNHAAREHPLFEASRDRASPYRRWFEWRDAHPPGWDIWGRDPWVDENGASYLATFGRQMPDFNFRNPQVVRFHQDNLRFWLNRGLDGVRLDAVPHLVENSATDWNDQPESRRLTHDYVQLIRSYPNRYVVCEATAAPAEYARPDLCHDSFAFGLQYEIVKAARGEAEAVAKVAAFYTTAPFGQASFVSNHDKFAGRRLWDQVGGDEARYRLAAATYLLLPGTPFIYYGEEIGMAGAAGLLEDPQIRGPMSWTADPKTGGFSTREPYRALATNVLTHNVAAQKADPGSIWHFYRQMLALRNTRVSIARGRYEAPRASGTVFTFVRSHGGERTLVALNYGDAPAEVVLADLGSLSGGPGGGPGGALAARPLFPGHGADAAADAHAPGNGRLPVPARSVRVWALAP